MLNQAVEKLFIILGEAAGRLWKAQRAQIGGVPRRQIIGLRNILAHGYEHVYHEALFRTVTADLGAVGAALAEALACAGGDGPR